MPNTTTTFNTTLGTDRPTQTTTTFSTSRTTTISTNRTTSRSTTFNTTRSTSTNRTTTTTFNTTTTASVSTNRTTGTTTTFNTTTSYTTLFSTNREHVMWVNNREGGGGATDTDPLYGFDHDSSAQGASDYPGDGKFRVNNPTGNPKDTTKITVSRYGNAGTGIDHSGAMDAIVNATVVSGVKGRLRLLGILDASGAAYSAPGVSYKITAATKRTNGSNIHYEFTVAYTG